MRYYTIHTMELTNKFRTLIVHYPNKKDINISMMLDDLNNKLVQKGNDDRNIVIQYIKKGDQFNVELIDIDGEVKFETDKYEKDFFDKLFDVVDNFPIDEITDSNKSMLTEETDTVSNNIPSDQYDQVITNKVKIIERLEADQERDTDLIGVTYSDGSDKSNNITKKDYWRMKSKYLKLKNKLTKNI